MDDGIDSLALDDLVDRVAVANITLDEGESLVLRDRLEAREISRVGQRIESDNRVSRMLLGPELNEVAADESSGSRDEYPTHDQLLRPSSRL
jgi:hypothetical protein